MLKRCLPPGSQSPLTCPLSLPTGRILPTPLGPRRFRLALWSTLQPFVSLETLLISLWPWHHSAWSDGDPWLFSVWVAFSRMSPTTRVTLSPFGNVCHRHCLSYLPCVATAQHTVGLCLFSGLTVGGNSTTRAGTEEADCTGCPLTVPSSLDTVLRAGRVLGCRLAGGHRPAVGVTSTGRSPSRLGVDAETLSRLVRG